MPQSLLKLFSEPVLHLLTLPLLFLPEETTVKECDYSLPLPLPHDGLAASPMALHGMLFLPRELWVWQITKLYLFLSLDLHLVTLYLTQSNMIKSDITGKKWSWGLNPSSLAWWATHTTMLPYLSFTASHTLQGWGTTNFLICVDSDLGIDRIAINSFSPAFQEYLLPLFLVWVSISSYLEGPW